MAQLQAEKSDQAPVSQSNSRHVDPSSSLPGSLQLFTPSLPHITMVLALGRSLTLASRTVAARSLATLYQQQRASKHTHTLVLIRHGESEWNKQNRFTGWYDVQLSEKGTRITVVARVLTSGCL